MKDFLSYIREHKKVLLLVDKSVYEKDVLKSLNRHFRTEKTFKIVYHDKNNTTSNFKHMNEKLEAYKDTIFMIESFKTFMLYVKKSSLKKSLENNNSILCLDSFGLLPDDLNYIRTLNFKCCWYRPSQIDMMVNISTVCCKSIEDKYKKSAVSISDRPNKHHIIKTRKPEILQKIKSIKVSSDPEELKSIRNPVFCVSDPQTDIPSNMKVYHICETPESEDIEMIRSMFRNNTDYDDIYIVIYVVCTDQDGIDNRELFMKTYHLMNGIYDKFKQFDKVVLHENKLKVVVR